MGVTIAPSARPAPSRLSPAVARQLGERRRRSHRHGRARAVRHLADGLGDRPRPRAGRVRAAVHRLPARRRGRRRPASRATALAVATDLVRCALHALLAVLIVTGAVRIWHLVAIGVVFGTAEAFYRPAASGLLPQTVPEDEIQAANAATMMFENVAEVAGPALATALVLGLSPAAAFGLDAATFLVSAALLVRVRPRDRGAAPPAARVERDAPRRRAFGARRPARGLRRGALARRGCGRRSPRSASRCSSCSRRCSSSARSSRRSATATSPSSATSGSRSARARSRGRSRALRWRPRYPLRYGMMLILLWPVAVALFAAGVPLELVFPAMAVGGAGCGAVRRLVGDGARGAHPAGQALARDVVRLGGVARAHAARLRPRRAGRRTRSARRTSCSAGRSSRSRRSRSGSCRARPGCSRGATSCPRRPRSQTPHARVPTA